jgi:hypothetical protein
MGSIDEKNQRTKISRYCPFKLNKMEKKIIQYTYRYQCCRTGATRSRNFWPEPELVFEVSALARGQTKVDYVVNNNSSY